MPFDSNGRWISVEETIRQINERRLDVQDFKAERQAPKPTQQQQDTQVRGYYERAVGSTTQRFGATSFDMGLGLTDQRAFDRCVDEFGYVRAVKALDGISNRATQLRPSLKVRPSK
jgi:hypothetical protein